MGTGGSKAFKKPKRQKVVAEIQVPGQTKPIKVKGEVNLRTGDDIGSHHSGAKVKEIGPNKFSIQVHDQDVVTFNTEGDFHTYLTNAAELKVTNIETVPDDDEDEHNPMMLSASYSFNLTPANLDNYSDDEDWADLIDNIDESQSSSDEIDGADINEAKQRKIELKKALQAKRANLTPQEYQQMIANHKQEMQLMEMLRQKELDRQKNSLASKVADRKKKRMERQKEKMQKQLLSENATTENEQSQTPTNNAQQSEMDNLKLHVLTQSNIELEAEINQRNKEFEEHMQNVRPLISEKEYRKLLLQHKAQVSAQSRKLEIGRDNQRIHLMEKLARRSKRKLSAEKENEQPLKSEEVKELQLALNTKDVEFRKQLTRTKSTMTSEAAEQMIKEHKQEMQQYQHQLEKERSNMQNDLMDRLNLRMNNDVIEGSSIFSMEDLKQLQLCIDAMSQTANDDIKKQKKNLTNDEFNQLLTKQRNENEAYQKQLEIEKIKTNELLKRRIIAKKYKMKSANSMIEWENVIGAATSQDVQELEVELQHCKDVWEKDKKEKKSIMSKDEYDALMKQHQEEVERLEKRLSRQRDAQRQHLLDKLAERRARKDKNAMAMTADEVKEMQLAIAGKDVSFKAELKVIKDHTSKEEIQKYINQHKEDMNNFQRQLDVEREKMKEKLLEKVTARQRKGLSNEDESLTQEEIKQAQVALDERNTVFQENVKETRSALTSAEYQSLLDNHVAEQRLLQDHLDREREKMNASFREKLQKRYTRTKHSEYQNATYIKTQIETERANFEKHRKTDMTEEEYQQLLKQHDEEMTRLQGLLDSSLDRQKLNMMDKLEARRRKKAMLTAEETEKRRLLLLLERDNITLEEIEQVIDDIEDYEIAAQEQLDEKETTVSEEEYKTLLAKHQKDMEEFQAKLDEQKKRMGDKLAARIAARSVIQSELQDDEEQMEEFAVLESSVDVSVLATKTQLWTTPVQSKALVVVPLPEEYPVRKKKELYTDPSIFRDIDTHAIKLAQTGSLVMYPTFSALVNELMRIGTSELEKARLAFRWITAQNCDEMDLSEVVDDTPLGVLKGIYFHKITFSTLFMRMCRFIGLRCVEINGCAKFKGYKPGMYISSLDQDFQHTWNAIRIDGHWHFVDCNWGVSHIADSVTFDPFRFEYDEHYFLADPEVIIATHFPSEVAWQLVPQPLTLQQYNAGVVLKPDFFKYNFGLLNFHQAVIPLKTGDLDLHVGHPSGFILSCKVTSVDKGKNTTSKGVNFDQFVFVHQVEENQMSIYIRFPEIGKYYLVIYAKKQYVDGQVNIETETEICRYQVICEVPSVDRYPLPRSPVDHWGPIGVGNAGLEPFTHRTAVIVSNGQSVTIGFKFSQHLFFQHELTCQEEKSNVLHSYIMHRKFNGNVLFTITPPHSSRFGVNIYIIYPNDPQQQKIHLCSYLVVANSGKQTDVLPIPDTDVHWGETRAFGNLGLSSVSHPDPFVIVQSGDTLRIDLGVSQPVFAKHVLHHYSETLDCSDLTASTYGQSTKGKITFLLHLPKKGYYVFKILGSDNNSTDFPMTLCFVYLIKKC
ncbi:uncharacterized protein [Antedon mediterranea]|uniref:uncharacterized protein n=1 Tax=Antedon mediterranea TaxID=105859 RepID=UPI003AF6E57C